MTFVVRWAERHHYQMVVPLPPPGPEDATTAWVAEVLKHSPIVAEDGSRLQPYEVVTDWHSFQSEALDVPPFLLKPQYAHAGHLSPSLQARVAGALSRREAYAEGREEQGEARWLLRLLEEVVDAVGLQFTEEELA